MDRRGETRLLSLAVEHRSRFDFSDLAWGVAFGRFTSENSCGRMHPTDLISCCMPFRSRNLFGRMRATASNSRRMTVSAGWMEQNLRAWCSLTGIFSFRARPSVSNAGIFSGRMRPTFDSMHPTKHET